MIQVPPCVLRWAFYFSLVLIADAGSKEDDRTGFTDTIISPWLQLSPLCSFDGRLTFRFSISNDRDHIEIYSIENNRTKTTSLGQWKGKTNKAHSIKVDDLSFQQGNITFQVSEQFQVRNSIQNIDKSSKNSLARLLSKFGMSQTIEIIPMHGLHSMTFSSKTVLSVSRVPYINWSLF